MMKKAVAWLLVASLSVSGCATLKPEEFAQYGYKGTPVVQEGRKILVLDWLGNIFGALEKLIIWNWKMERHNIQPDTEKALHDYLQRSENLGDLAIQLNRYAPQDSWRRLFRNKGVKWPYRYTLGILSVLILDTLLVDRIFGGDRYDPYTHTLHLFSDLPSVALHELGHAQDFAERRYRGSYALFRIIPFADLYQEYKASHGAFHYIREQKMTQTELEAYKVLYPAYGTYAGGYLFGYGMILGALIGHALGRYRAHQFQERIDRGLV